MHRLLILPALLSVGCATLPNDALTSTKPTADDVQQVRAVSIRVMDAVAAAAGIANSVGAVINELPLSNEVKDAYDCAILRAVGTPESASATVISVCGFTPALTAKSPLAMALTELGAVTTCPNVYTTSARVLVAIEPLIALLEGSSQMTVRIVAASLRAVMSPLRALLEGSGKCFS